MPIKRNEGRETVTYSSMLSSWTSRVIDIRMTDKSFSKFSSDILKACSRSAIPISVFMRRVPIAVSPNRKGRSLYSGTGLYDDVVSVMSGR